MWLYIIPFPSFLYIFARRTQDARSARSQEIKSNGRPRLKELIRVFWFEMKFVPCSVARVFSRPKFFYCASARRARNSFHTLLEIAGRAGCHYSVVLC